MKESRQPTAAVIGAGVSGLTAAYLLRQHPRRHPVRGRRPARRPRPHPRRCRPPTGSALARRQRLHRAQRAHLPEPAAAVRRARRGDPTDRDEHEHHLRRAAGWRTPAAGASAGILAQRAPPAPTRGSCGCWPRCPGSTAGPAHCPRGHRDDDPTWGEFLDRGGFSRVLRRALRGPAGGLRLVLRGRRRPRLPGPLPVRVPRPPRDADRRPGPPRGARSSAGRATYVDRLARPPARRPLRHRGDRRDPARRRRRGARPPTAPSTTLRPGRRSPPTPTRPSRILADADPDREARDLGAIGYSTNHTWLHRDASVLPANARARASWNYRMDACDDGLARRPRQLLDEPAAGLDDADDLRRHPQRRRPGRPGHGRSPRWTTSTRSTPPTPVAAPQRLRTRRRRPARVRRRLPGLGLPRGRLPLRRRGRRGVRGDLVSPESPSRPTDLPALVVGSRSATRGARPLRHAFTYRHYQWLVDLDALPRLPLAARPARPLRRPRPPRRRSAGRQHPRRRRRGSSPRAASPRRGDRVLMLAHARVLGHVFDPMTVFWCLDPDGDAARRRRRGAQHLRRPARLPARPGRRRAGRTVDKEFYVSPFNDVDGRYTMRFRLTPSSSPWPSR